MNNLSPQRKLFFSQKSNKVSFLDEYLGQTHWNNMLLEFLGGASHPPLQFEEEVWKGGKKWNNQWFFIFVKQRQHQSRNNLNFDSTIKKG